MADRYYQVNMGGDMHNDVTEAGASAGAVPFEFRATYDATGNSKVNALKALDAIKQYIIADTWPPV